MIKAEIDITKPVKSFSYFAEIGAAIDDVKYCLGEIKKSGNLAVIENYIAAVRKDLDQIESVLSNV